MRLVNHRQEAYDMIYENANTAKVHAMIALIDAITDLEKTIARGLGIDE